MNKSIVSLLKGVFRQYHFSRKLPLWSISEQNYSIIFPKTALPAIDSWTNTASLTMSFFTKKHPLWSISEPVYTDNINFHKKPPLWSISEPVCSIIFQKSFPTISFFTKSPLCDRLVNQTTLTFFQKSFFDNIIFRKSSLCEQFVNQSTISFFKRASQQYHFSQKASSVID